MAVDADQLMNILEASLLVAGRPMSVAQLEGLFEQEEQKPTRDEIRATLVSLQESYSSRGIELVEVASGFRMQARQEYSPYISNLFQERAPRYSRALLETLVLIAYRQPITRGEIEDVRGVAVSSNIIKTLLERDWIRVLGHRDVPGRPAILGTTKQFLDYFNLKRIDELPTLSEIKDLDQIDPELAKEVALLEGACDEEGDPPTTSSEDSDPEDPQVVAAIESDPLADESVDEVVADVMAEKQAGSKFVDDNGADEEQQVDGVSAIDEAAVDEACDTLDQDGHVDVHLDLGSSTDDTLSTQDKSRLAALEETETLH